MTTNDPPLSFRDPKGRPCAGIVAAWAAFAAARVAVLEAALNGSYRERAQLLGLAAVNYPALITEALDIPCDHRTCEGRHWHLLVLTIDGHQATWHIHPDDMGLWSHVPYVPPDDPRVQWDGHTTEQKYERILEYTVRVGDAAHEAEQPAGDGEAEREAVAGGEAPVVPELTDELLRTLPVLIAAAVYQLKLKHEGQRRHAEAAEQRQEELRAEVRRLERALADVDMAFRLPHGGAYCATCHQAMREGTPVVKTLAVVCEPCAADLAATAGRLDPSRLAARDEAELEPCGHDGGSLGERYPLVCALPGGHRGFHSDGKGASWTNTESSALDALTARDEAGT